MEVGQLVSLSFAQAIERFPEEHEEWRRISQHIGNYLPDSLLIISVQQAGRLDILIRSMEEEFSVVSSSQNSEFTLQLQYQFTDLWIGQVYEIIRLLKERKFVPDNPDFDSLAHDLRLIRIPLVKHEITGDRNAPIPLLQRQPPMPNDTPYKYVKDDSMRSFIMPKGLSARGSVMWNVLDIQFNRSYWIERQDLTERIFALFSKGDKL